MMIDDAIAEIEGQTMTNATNYFRFPNVPTALMPVPGSSEAISRKLVVAQMRQLFDDERLCGQDCISEYERLATKAIHHHITLLTALKRRSTIIRLWHYISEATRYSKV